MMQIIPTLLLTSRICPLHLPVSPDKPYPSTLCQAGDPSPAHSSSQAGFIQHWLCFQEWDSQELQGPGHCSQRAPGVPGCVRVICPATDTLRPCSFNSFSEDKYVYFCIKSWPLPRVRSTAGAFTA